MGRSSGRVEPAVGPQAGEEPMEPDRPGWLLPAIIGLVVAAIGAGIGAGMTRGPKDGAAVFIGVLVIGLLFGSLLRPPPLRDQPGDGTAIDFGLRDPAAGGAA